jgi:hypothetical protein
VRVYEVKKVRKKKEVRRPMAIPARKIQVNGWERNFMRFRGLVGERWRVRGLIYGSRLSGLT